MHTKIRRLLSAMSAEVGIDGIYSSQQAIGDSQLEERRLRERVAAERYDDYYATIAANHSIAVMDHEVDRFLDSMPESGLILDIGGCWGWHWRRLVRRRRDIGVIIIDFVRANLRHARNILGGSVGEQIVMVHADATHLPFPDAGCRDFDGFDGIWTVQVLQHIPDFRRACEEAKRVLKAGGRFINYSLHATPLNRLIYGLLRKNFHVKGPIPELFYLERATDAQRDELRAIFGEEVVERYTECLFHPDLRLTFSGREGSIVGRLDVLMSEFPKLGCWIARQRSFATIKSQTPLSEQWLPVGYSVQ